MDIIFIVLLIVVVFFGFCSSGSSDIDQTVPEPPDEVN